MRRRDLLMSSVEPHVLGAHLRTEAIPERLLPKLNEPLCGVELGGELGSVGGVGGELVAGWGAIICAGISFTLGMLPDFNAPCH